MAAEQAQLALLQVPVDPHTLPPRQQLAYAALQRAGHEGLDPGEAGAVWHAHKGIHPLDGWCKYCPDEGRSILGALQAKGLATRRRANRVRGIPGAWLAANVNEGVEDDTIILPGMTTEIPY